MVQPTAYILHLRPDRVDVFRRCVAAGGEFEEPVPRYQQSPSLCFLCAKPGLLTHLSRRTPRVRKYAGTGLSLLACQDMRELPVHVPLATLLSVVKIRNFNDFQKRLDGGFLPETACRAMLDTLIAISPPAAPMVQALLAPRDDLDVPQPIKQRWALERDGLAFLFEVAGFDREDITAWSSPPLHGHDMPSYFAGLRIGRLLEPEMVLHDAHRFPGFELLGHDGVRGIEFVRSNHLLRVFFADKTVAELDGGIDILYFNERYESFVAVQYKVIDGVYYPDDQLRQQVLRMHALADAIARASKDDHTGDSAVDGFRICPQPFFLKFCGRISNFDVKCTDMIRGMYVPLPLWETFLASDALRGKSGVTVVNGENIARYFDNTHFTELVRDAWIGTTPRQYRAAVEMIRHIKETGRSWIIAQHVQANEAKARA